MRFIILRLLHDRPCAGSEIVAEIVGRSRGLWRPSPGSIYPAISVLRRSGYIVDVGAGRGAVKRYALTEAGRAILRTQADALTLHQPWFDLVSSFPAADLDVRPGWSDLWEGWRKMVQSLRRVNDLLQARPAPPLAAQARAILQGAAASLDTLSGGAPPGADPTGSGGRSGAAEAHTAGRTEPGREEAAPEPPAI